MGQYNPQIHHRRSIRLKGYDYSQAGLYFITICCQDREYRFGEIIRPNYSRQIMYLNEFGRIAHDEWLKTPEIRPNVALGEFVIMPNHMHGIIQILYAIDKIDSCNMDDRGGVCNMDDRGGVCNTPPRSPSNTVGAIVRGYKSAVVRQMRTLGFDGKLWQRNYYEHIIRDENSHRNIARYINNNPANWAKDNFYIR